jgi:hypothetical protein
MRNSTWPGIKVPHYAAGGWFIDPPIPGGTC